MKLPVQPPIAPMLADLARDLPAGNGWLYEPKWDGFRALVFWDGSELLIQSRDLKPLGRYFPELEALQQRIHPVASRIEMLAREIPAEFVAFDLLATCSHHLMGVAQSDRRVALEQLLGTPAKPLHLTPCSSERATASDWFEQFEGAGLDGVIAKRGDGVYQPGARVMLKIKHQRTVDCVVSGFRWQKDYPGTAVGSLLLGLYDDNGVL